MNFDYYRRELEREWEPIRQARTLDESIQKFHDLFGDSMTFYVEFEDGTEFVVCCDDEQEARENTIDMQKTAKKSTVITNCKQVAER